MYERKDLRGYLKVLVEYTVLLLLCFKICGAKSIDVNKGKELDFAKQTSC